MGPTTKATTFGGGRLLAHPSDPSATIELWFTDPKGTRQMPTLSGKPPAPGEWIFVTTMSVGDIYLKAEIADKTVALETLWPNAAADIRAGLKTGGGAGLTEAQRLAVGPSWDTISTVRNWGDLRAQTPVPMGTKFRARFGIDRKSAGKWDTALIYCLLDSPNPEGPPAGPEANQQIASLGVAGHNGARPLNSWLGRFMAIYSPPAGTREALYIVAVPMITDVDNYIELSIPWNRTPFARVRVENSGRPAHPWIPLSRADGNPGPVTLNSSFITSPSCLASLPFATTSDGSEIDDDTKLPTSVPADTNHTLTLSATEAADGGFDLVISADGALLGAKAQHGYLAKIWINGEPYTPQKPQFTELSAVSDERPPQDSHQFRLHFAPSDVGATKGDTIGLQLLHFPDGFGLADREVLRGRLLEHALQRTPLLTERVEFIVP